jgi:hypothetical protein
MLNSNGQLRKELYKLGDIHLSAAGTRIVSLRIQTMLYIMLPKVQALVQAPTANQAPEVAQAPPVQPPVVVQPLVFQHVAVVQDQVESPIEVDEDEILRKLFLKKFGCALPEVPKKSDVDELDMDLIDLTEGPDEMEATPDPVPSVVVVKTEPIDTYPNAPNAANLSEARKERRAFNKFAKSAKIFVKKLSKSNWAPNLTLKKVRKIQIAAGVDQVIPEKEAPTDSNVSEAAEFEKDLIGIYRSTSRGTSPKMRQWTTPRRKTSLRTWKTTPMMRRWTTLRRTTLRKTIKNI